MKQNIWTVSGKQGLLRLCLLGVLLTLPGSLTGLTIEARIEQGAWRTTHAIYPLKGQAFELRVTKHENSRIRWFQILPDLSKMYKNANHPWEKDPYKWVGFGKIDYKRIELEDYRDKWRVSPEFYKSFFFSPPYYRSDIGSFWLQAVVYDPEGDVVASSPGLKSNDYRGLSPKVFRVSIREGKGYIGYLTSFFNVPALFGSIPYQSYHYIGTDCADVLIAAYARWKRKPVPKDYNVAMLVERFGRKAEFKLREGQPDRPVYWNKTIRPGDFIAVRFRGRRQFQHVGALYKDANQNGKLDAEDEVIHAGPRPLQIHELGYGAFDGFVVVLRP